jgi:WD40 repeat protein
VIGRKVFTGESKMTWSICRLWRILPILMLVVSESRGAYPCDPSESKPKGLLCMFAGHDPCNFIKFSGDGRMLASSGGIENRLILRDSSNRRPNHCLQTGWASPFCFSPDSKTIAFEGGGKNNIKICDVQTGKDKAILRGHQGIIQRVVYLPDGDRLISCSDDRTIKIWDLHCLRAECTLMGHEGAIYEMTLSRDGRLLATGSGDGTAKLWDVRTGKMLHTLGNENHPVVLVQFSPDARTLITQASGVGRLHVWDVGTGDWRFDGLHKKVGSDFHTFAPDSRFVIVSHRAEISFWDLQTRRETEILKGHRGTVKVAVLSPQGQLLASGDKDGVIKIWDVRAKTELATVTAHDRSIDILQFSPDGRLLVSAGFSDKLIKIWDVERLTDCASQKNDRTQKR